MNSAPEIASSPLLTKYGAATLYVFSWSHNEQDNVLVLMPPKNSEIPFVRIQSACYTGEILESKDCDCHWQLETSLALIHKEGGALVYMLKDGRGAGLLAKVRGMALSHRDGIDTAEAYKRLGIPLDPRDYDQVAYVLRHLGIEAMRLLTNNPRKVLSLQSFGFVVQRVCLESIPTLDNQNYLRAKAQKLGHLMKAFGTDIPEF